MPNKLCSTDLGAEYKEKQERVELHAHTKMSAMDGVVSATDKKSF